MQIRISALSGKKLLFLLGTVVLLAASCNSQTAKTPVAKPPVSQSGSGQSQTQTQNQTTAGVEVDSAVNQLNAAIDSEDSINMQTDSDLIITDKSILDGANGVNNATY